VRATINNKTQRREKCHKSFDATHVFWIIDEQSQRMLNDVRGNNAYVLYFSLIFLKQLHNLKYWSIKFLKSYVEIYLQKLHFIGANTISHASFPALKH